MPFAVKGLDGAKTVRRERLGDAAYLELVGTIGDEVAEEVDTLAGYITARDKSTLLFAIYALGPNVQDNAKDAIDKLATDFFRCGTQLSNN